MPSPRDDAAGLATSGGTSRQVLLTRPRSASAPRRTAAAAATGKEEESREDFVKRFQGYYSGRGEAEATMETPTSVSAVSDRVSDTPQGGAPAPGAAGGMLESALTLHFDANAPFALPVLHHTDATQRHRRRFVAYSYALLFVVKLRRRTQLAQLKRQCSHVAARAEAKQLTHQHRSPSHKAPANRTVTSTSPNKRAEQTRPSEEDSATATSRSASPSFSGASSLLTMGSASNHHNNTSTRLFTRHPLPTATAQRSTSLSLSRAADARTGPRELCKKMHKMRVQQQQGGEAAQTRTDTKKASATQGGPVAAAAQPSPPPPLSAQAAGVPRKPKYFSRAYRFLPEMETIGRGSEVAAAGIATTASFSSTALLRTSMPAALGDEGDKREMPSFG
ncbi:hypothetical protein STCU_11733 [Strigomonas culicis]|uniref:Uncharacterized protein n=1 Tax=Strigomonas culicis TaxID=28005 RepID=S9UM94_9TRYP|nr:hypothetical protein STCU_11733 [Strigomonas culicis]|eukprot:EPY15826.1 hypothetical protein STCU_11733 [Strigomonas culicis]